MEKVSVLILLIIFCYNVSAIEISGRLVYGYRCQQGVCVKVELSEQNYDKAISLPVCKMICDESIGTLWPKPKKSTFDLQVIRVNISQIQFQLPNHSTQAKIWRSVQDRFMVLLKTKILDYNTFNGGDPLNIKISVVDPEASMLTLETDESYQLKIEKNATLNAVISAKTFYGARHGLETLSQLFVYDDIRRELQLLAKAEIIDEPKFKWRSVLLDTSRNFFSIKSIKRTLDAMAMVKLNTFHWHITDSHSFPLQLIKHPEFHELGAYARSKIYSQNQVRDLVNYANLRGIRIVPEFDAPAHVGEGWQHKNMTACFKAQPWSEYCVEPPCGQLDPTVDELYDVLEDIYSEIFDIFKPEIFHMGGDEVSVKCWNSSENIIKYLKSKNLGLEEAEYMKLWSEFQNKALKRVRIVSGNKKSPVVLWTSHLTEIPYIDYLNNKDYIIQVWTNGMDPKVKEILKRGYRIIVSNSDALYFDCGGPAWVKEGNNWCSPYIGWQKVYENNLEDIAGDYLHHVLGAEAAVWTEQIDELTLDSRLWPRASAMAERLWSDPQKSTWRQAESRMLFHRETLVENGIGAEALQPAWCLQNEGECPETNKLF